MSTYQSFTSLARAMLLGFRRDKGALFFTVLFPLMFLVIFGGVFGHQATAKVTVVAAGPVPLVDRAVAHDGDLAGTLKVVRAASRDAALKKVEKGDADAFVEQSGNALNVRYSVADQVKSGTARGLLSSIAQSANLAATGRPPAYTVTEAQVEDRSLKAIQFFTPSLLGWALASAGVFGASQTLVTWRTKGILRRLRLSPAPVPTVFAARVAVSLGIALVQFAVFVAVAHLPFFGLKLTGDWWLAIPTLMAGVLAFLGIGTLIGSWAKTQETAQLVGQLVVLPMAFLGGSFFPLDSMPGWMRAVSYVFPLRYLNQGMLDVMGRGLGPGSVLVPIAVLLGVALVTALLAVRVFRWDAA
ncbi:ABC transporter permease [Actinomadura parmotrematis]|uniref:ABC transporter permease n=1 Tax=Actinomadura parmotrematis TaxID=2864039 RepID=A0ABS7FZQ6_9ACTN|nr:ABC transporter permease [Actinomadura parmotrematis]MBW8484913.1 ABC transporter permease [Actinomadura parmotrematis]